MLDSFSQRTTVSTWQQVLSHGHIVTFRFPVRAIEMRIADRKEGLRLGGETSLDGAKLAEFDQALDDIQAINREIWAILVGFGLPL